MGFALHDIVPWGRNLDEYRKMFSLTVHDLNKSILACADGPASFNAELTAHGGRSVSIDPIYAFTTEQISNRIIETTAEVYGQLYRNKDDYTWAYYQTPEKLLEVRLSAMNNFLSDYEYGKMEGRYRSGSLPNLAFVPENFDLALCSHFLFTYSSHLSVEFHQESILQMLGKSLELRIFPVCSLNGNPSPHLPPIEFFLKERQLEYRLEQVDHEFQRGGNIMLRIFRKKN